MLTITLADLRFRSRQFLIAIVGAGVVFALAVLMSGMANGFHTEITDTVTSTGADVWVVPTGASGPSPRCWRSPRTGSRRWPPCAESGPPAAW